MVTGTLCVVCKGRPPEDQISVGFWVPGDSVALYRRRLGAVLELELSEDDLSGRCLCVRCESRLNRIEQLRRMQEVFKQQFLTAEPQLIAGHSAQPDEVVPPLDNKQQLTPLLYASPETETDAPLSTERADEGLIGATSRDSVSKRPVDVTSSETYCDICNTTLATPRGLRLHQRIHERVTSRLCKVCGRECTTPSSLQLHIQQEHGALRLYQCRLCAFTSASPTAIRTHTRRKHPGQNPDFTYLLNDIPEWPESQAAVATMQRESLLTVPRRSKRKQEYSCLKCTSTFAEVAALAEHMVSNHRLTAAGRSNNKEGHKPGISVLERDRELKIEANSSEGAVHMKEELPVSVNNEDCSADPGDDICSTKNDDVSESSVPEDSEVYNHLYQHEMVQTVKENLPVSYEATILPHKSETDKSVGSPVCKMSCSPQGSVEEKEVAENSDGVKNLRTNKQQGTARCPHCTRTFRHEVDLVDHIRDHEEGKVLPCTVCQMGFKQQASLHNHMLKHTGLYPHRCLDCGKGFAQAWALKNHAAVHSKATPYLCRHCPVRFTTLHQRRMHSKRQHPQKQEEAMKVIKKEDATFSCQTCDKTFRRKLNLTAHLETHSTTKTAECQLCMKKFKGKSQLASHMHWHSLESKKVKDQKFLCEECGKSYKNLKGLRDHIRCHRGDRTFSCPLCQLVVPNQSRLQKHVETVHSPARPYTCDLCDKSFVYKISYNAHCNMHKDLRPFLCSTCGKGFRTRPHLKEHMNVHSQTKSFLCNQCSLTFMWRAQLIRHKNHAHADPSVPKAPKVKRGPRKKTAKQQASESCPSLTPLETVNPAALEHGVIVSSLEPAVGVSPLEPAMIVRPLEHGLAVGPEAEAAEPPPAVPPLTERVPEDSHVMLPPDTGTFLQLNGSMVRGQLLQNLPIQAFLQQPGAAGRTTYVIRPSHMGLVAEVLPEGHPLQQQQQGQQQQHQLQQEQHHQPQQQLELQQQQFQSQQQQ